MAGNRERAEHHCWVPQPAEKEFDSLGNGEIVLKILGEVNGACDIKTKVSNWLVHLVDQAGRYSSHYIKENSIIANHNSGAVFGEAIQNPISSLRQQICG